MNSTCKYCGSEYVNGMAPCDCHTLSDSHKEMIMDLRDKLARKSNDLDRAINRIGQLVNEQEGVLILKSTIIFLREDVAKLEKQLKEAEKE